MARWIVTAVVIILAAGAGYLVGRQRSMQPAASAPQSGQRLEETVAELTRAREENHELQTRLEQLTREQERLAQENEILRKQETTERLTAEPGGELPARPPK